MIALDLALGLGMVRRTTNVGHLVVFEVLFQRIRDKSRAIIRQQSGTMADFDMRHAGFCHCDVEGFLDIGAAHGGGQPPGEDIARIVVQHGTQIVVAPIHHFELGEVRLPQLIHPFGGMLELVLGAHQLKHRIGDQIIALQDATLDSEMKYPCVSVICQANWRGDNSVFSKATSTTCSRTPSGMRFQNCCRCGCRSARPS